MYGKRQLSEGEVRVARTRAEFALWGRQQARRYAEAKRRPKKAVGHNKADEALPPPKEDEVRWSLYLPTRFQEHLMRQEEFFLHYLRGHYGVSIFVDSPKKVHIKGPRPNVMDCYQCVKELLVRWHQRQAGEQ